MNARQKAKYCKRKYEQIANQSMESLIKEVRRRYVGQSRSVDEVTRGLSGRGW